MILPLLLGVGAGVALTAKGSPFKVGARGFRSRRARRRRRRQAGELAPSERATSGHPGLPAKERARRAVQKHRRALAGARLA